MAFNFFAILVAFTAIAAQVPADHASSCCTALAKAGLSDRLLFPDSDTYQSRVDSYFSRESRLAPSCFIQPESALEVSQAIAALVAEKTCTFAVRSGGHMLWRGSNNIEDGATIDLSRLTTTTYHPEKETASLSPGSSWQSVYEELEKDGVAVMGGRTGTVGVGGLVLGGGLSMFTARRGFVCDGVKEFEVVLTNGTITVANAQTNNDLFKALKGGASNFGIVTRYEVEAFPIDKIWGGLVLWDDVYTDGLVDALIEFTDGIESDPYSTVFLMWWYAPKLFPGMSTVLSGMHNTKAERPASFERFYEFESISNTTRLANLTSFGPELEIEADNWNIWLTATFKNDARVMKKSIEQQALLVEEMKILAGEDGFGTSCEWQPLPRLFSEHSIAKGGNVLGLDRDRGNLLIFTAHLSFEDGTLQEQARELLTKLWFEPVVEYGREIEVLDEFVYLNYADGSQSPLKGYGEENVRFIGEVARKYDPEAVMQTRIPGGFKISKV